MVTDEYIANLKSLIERTNRENPSHEDVKALRGVLAKDPKAWRLGGDLAIQNEHKLIAETKMSVAAREMLIAALDAMRRELGYEESPMLEQLLIECVLLAWLRWNLWEHELTSLEHEGGMTVTMSAFWEKRISAAQRRYLQACETLARVRKITRATMQINIAEEGAQQVNIAGDYVKGKPMNQ